MVVIDTLLVIFNRLKNAVKKHVEIENVLAQDGTVADTFEL